MRLGKVNCVEVVSVTIIALLIVIVVGFNVITKPGIPILAEQIEAFNEDNFIKTVQTWDDGLSRISIADLPKIYLYNIVHFLSKFFGFEIIIKLFLILPHSVAFLISYYFIRNEFFNRKITISTFIIIVAISVIYSFNPWITHRGRNLMLRWQYAFSPMLIYCWIEMLKNRKFFAYSLFFAIVLSLVETTRFIFKIILPLSLITLSYILYNRRKEKIKSILKKITITTLISCSLLTPVYLPLMYVTLISPPEAYQMFTIEIVTGENPLNSFSLFITNYPGKHFTSPYPKNDKNPFIFLLISIFSIASIFYVNRFEKQEHSAWLAITCHVLLIITLYFSMLKEAPYSDFVLNIFKYFPLFGRVYRSSYHNATFLPLYYMILLAYLYRTLIEILKSKFKIVIVCTTIGLVSAALISSWPLLTGDLNGYWRPTIIPEDYILLNEYMSKDNKDKYYHTLWFPTFGTKKAIWINATSPYDKPPIGIFALRSSYLPTYLYMDMYFFKYYNPIGMRPYYRPIECYYGLSWGDILAPLNVKYLIIHYDIKGEDYNRMMYIVDKLRNDSSLSLYYSGKYLSAFIIKDPYPPVYVNNFTVAVFKGLTTHSSLSEFLRGISLIYLEQKLGGCDLKNVECIVSSGNVECSIILSLIADSESVIYVQPNKYAQRTSNPRSLWAYCHAVSSYDFHLKYKQNINAEKFAWDFDYGCGLVYTWAKSAKLVCPFNIEKSDVYRVFIRYFKNQRGGEIRIHLGDEIITTETKEEFDTFVWEELGVFRLEKGGHEIILENVNGFNAVNLFALVPEEEYCRAREEMKEVLQNKTIIYLFEAETDFHSSDARAVKNVYASNGKILTLDKGDEAWLDIEIVKSGTYRLAFRGEGRFNIRIGERSFILSLKPLNFIYSPLIHLYPGKYRLEVISLTADSSLDVAWLYSTEENETIDQIFRAKESPAEIISYVKVHPTLWKVKVNSFKPFMLGFAEAYDPLWEAIVYKNGNVVEKVKAAPLYGVINGFWINETGNLDIVIRFKPQDLFEFGLTISTTTFIGCVVYLVYERRRLLQKFYHRYDSG